MTQFSRRNFIQTCSIGAAAGLVAGAGHAQDVGAKTETQSPWPLVLNASTIRPTPLREKIAIAAETGYDGIELWINELQDFETGGGDLKDLRKEIDDLGLSVPNIIGLWNCMPPTQEEWEAVLPETRERMRMSAAVGSKHVAAIPAPDRADFDLGWLTECYRNLLRIGREDYGIITAFEFVGFFEGVNRLGEASAVALDANDPDACLVADTFHLWRGGSGFHGLEHLRGEFIAVFHWNDVPKGAVEAETGDEDRIMPGEGMLPLAQVLQTLRKINFQGPLSLELFSRPLWESDPREVAKSGIEKMRAGIAQALDA